MEELTCSDITVSIFVIIERVIAGLRRVPGGLVGDPLQSMD